MNVTIQVNTNNPLEIQQAIQYLQSLLTEAMPVIKTEKTTIQQMQQNTQPQKQHLGQQGKSADDLLQEADQDVEFTDF